MILKNQIQNLKINLKKKIEELDRSEKAAMVALIQTKKQLKEAQFEAATDQDIIDEAFKYEI